MKIVLFGYGKMGQLVEQQAKERGHQIVDRFSRQFGTCEQKTQELVNADLAIDFSHPSAVLNHLNICLSLNIPIVIGTTGWDEYYMTAQHLVQQAKGSCLYSPNFSIGFFLFQQAIIYAASLFQQFSDYDVSGIEYHHKHKIDQPSGTAKSLKNEILNHMPRLTSFDFTSVRCGYIPGTHTLNFDGPADTLSFTHQARNRQGFAHGALLASEWLHGKKGFYTFKDMMEDYGK